MLVFPALNGMINRDTHERNFGVMLNTVHLFRVRNHFSPSYQCEFLSESAYVTNTHLWNDRLHHRGLQQRNTAAAYR